MDSNHTCLRSYENVQTAINGHIAGLASYSEKYDNILSAANFQHAE